MYKRDFDVMIECAGRSAGKSAGSSEFWSVYTQSIEVEVEEELQLAGWSSNE